MNAESNADLERAVHDFEESWRSGNAPNIQSFLANSQSLPQVSRSLLLRELIKVDLEFRWRPPTSPRPFAVACYRLENYAGFFPELLHQGKLPLDLISEEYRVRHRWGDKPTHQEFLARFPEHSAYLPATLKRIDKELIVEFGDVSHSATSESIAKSDKSQAAKSKPQHDRNLLFGVLALQMDFISRDALITAMNAWVLNKAQPLGEILCTQNALTPDNRAWLEAGVERHLAMHGHDAQKSLASVSSVASVRKDLEQIADPDVQASLVHAATAASKDNDPAATVSVGTSSSTGLRFRIVRPHAEGGLGKVYVAHDEELHREVALKEIIDRHADNRESRSRFLLEAEITGGLEHPGIVPVYGLGQYADGRPFYAMRFIKGDSLKDAIERFHKADQSAPEPTERALQLRRLLGRFIDVCQAIQYAHDRGVLHRDLKPGNIMLGRYGETLVVDWGLAKPLGATDAASEESILRPASASGSAATLQGSAIGTPQYMSPEQAAGRLDQLGPASDVYSLGATLYCLLTSRPPVEDKDVGVALQKVQRGDIPRPRTINPEIDPALEAVCLKAMAVKPGSRYVTPLALANDVECWLADKPVSARPEPWTVKTRRWVGQHRTLVTGTAATLLAGLVSTAIIAVLLGSAFETEKKLNAGLIQANADEKKARDEADQRREQADKLAKKNEQLVVQEKKARVDADQRRDEALKLAKENKLLAIQEMNARKETEAQQKLAETRYCAAQISRAQQEWAVHRSAEAWFQLEKTPPDLRGWEYDHVRGLFEKNQVILRGHTKPAVAVMFSPDGKRVASASQDGTVRLWDVDTGRQVRIFSAQKDRFQAIAFNHDGTRLASAAGNTTNVWDVDMSDKPLFSKRHAADMTSVAFSPDGKRVVSGSFGGTVWLWDLYKDDASLELKGHTGRIWAFAFKSDGKRLASASEDKTVLLWELDQKQPTSRALKGHTDRVFAVAFSSDGEQIASASGDNTVRLWPVDKEAEPRIIKGRFDEFSAALAFSPDGKRLVHGSHFGAVELWDVQADREPAYFMGHTKRVAAVAFSPDGKHLASASDDSTVRLWDVEKRQEPLVLGGFSHGEQSIFSPSNDILAFSPNGKRLAAAAVGEKTLRLWDIETGGRRDLTGHTGTIPALAFSPDGKRLASASHDRTIRLWNSEKDEGPSILKGHSFGIHCLAFSPNGERLASGSADAVRVWDAEKKVELFPLKGHANIVFAVTFSPDGKHVASASGDGTVRLWDLQTRTQAHFMDGKFGLLSFASPRAATSSPDGKRLFTLSLDNTVRLWDVDKRLKTPILLKGQLSAAPLDEKRLVVGIAVSRDGRWLASASMDGAVRLWDLEKADEPRALKGQSETASAVAFSPDGKRLASASHDGSVRLWDVDTGVEILVLKGHRGPVTFISFSQDGTRLASASNDGTVRVWEAQRAPVRADPK